MTEPAPEELASIVAIVRPWLAAEGRALIVRLPHGTFCARVLEPAEWEEEALDTEAHFLAHVVAATNRAFVARAEARS